MLLAFVMLDIVYIAVVVNYVTQCNLLIFLIHGLNDRLKEKTKTYDFQKAIKVCVCVCANFFYERRRLQRLHFFLIGVYSNGDVRSSAQFGNGNCCIAARIQFWDASHFRYIRGFTLNNYI